MPASAGISPAATENARTGRPAVLVLDDEGLMRWSMRERLTQRGYCVVEAETGAEGLALVRARTPDLVLLDVELPDTDGLAFLAKLRSERISCPVILVTAYPSPELAEKAASLGARRCLAKPFDLDEMVSAVETELARA